MLFSKLQIQILALFFSRKGEEFFMSEVGKALGKKPGVFQRAINSLEKQAILISRRRGNQRVFHTNELYPFLKEIESIVEKSAGVVPLLKEQLETLEKIKIAILYGSYAKNTMSRDSDIDLMVIAEDPTVENALLEILENTEQKICREINHRLYTSQEFDDSRKSREPFLARVLSEPYVILKGSL